MARSRLRGFADSRKTRLAATMLAGLAWSGVAAAAPFCLQKEGMTPLCIYYDPSVCQRDAQHQNAQCATNRSEVKVQGGIGQYCMVTAARVSVCHYQNLESCLRDARQQNGACTDSPTPIPNRVPNPYSNQGY